MRLKHVFCLLTILLIMGCEVESSASNSTVVSTQPSTQSTFKTKAEWKKELPTCTFEVMFEGQTERPFKNAYYNEKRRGIYVSAATGKPLFSSQDKYDSGTGWPSFVRPINESAVIIRPDPDGSGRMEVIDASSGGHLGHVFDDGPEPTGKRFCINSAALKFIPDESENK